MGLFKGRKGLFRSSSPTLSFYGGGNWGLEKIRLVSGLADFLGQYVIENQEKEIEYFYSELHFYRITVIYKMLVS